MSPTISQSSCDTHTAAALSDRGPRSENEDAILCEPALGLFAVADGMGGYQGGAVASRLVMEAVAEHFRQTHHDLDDTWPLGQELCAPLDERNVDKAFRHAHLLVDRHRHGDLAQMGATLALLYLGEEDVVVGHVGDSRVYHLSQGKLTQLTRDHSMYELMKRDGFTDLPPVEHYPFKNVVTRALGNSEDDGRPEMVRVARRLGDTFLLCSDGLSDSLPAQTLTREMLAGGDPEGICGRLVQAALEAGSTDNVSVVVVRPGTCKSQAS